MLTRVAVLALALVACGSVTASPLDPPRAAPAPSPALFEEEEAPGRVVRVYAARLQIAITGALELAPQTLEIELRVVQIMGGRHPRETWFYSVHPSQPVRLPDDRLLLFTADLSPGLWTGPGRYELGERAGVTVGGTAGISSAAYVQIFAPGDAEGFARFDRIDAPCVLTAGRDDLTGTVHCPSLLDEHDRSVELHWNWARL